MMNLLASEIEVYPITRSRDRVLGVTAYKSLTDLPEPVDLVIVVVAAKFCAPLMSEVRKAGARNAAILAAQILAVADGDLQARLQRYKEELAEKVAERAATLREKLSEIRQTRK
jgi:acyl-CoA synthetase (NDP forming)